MKLVRYMSYLLILLISMLLTPSGSQAVEGSEATGTGNAEHGRALFTGGRAFSNGAAPCAACHTLVNRGINGGTMATDQSGLFVPENSDAIAEIITLVEAPVMKKMYADRPLTKAELADLAAFARQLVPVPTPIQQIPFPLAGAGAGMLMLVGFALYKRRIS